MATNVFRGSSDWGVPVASLSGRQVFKGPSTNGVPIEIIDGPDVQHAAMAAAAYLLFLQIGGGRLKLNSTTD